MNLQKTGNNQAQQQQASPLQGGFVIDEQGREVPITEEMIQSACRDLEQHQQRRR